MVWQLNIFNHYHNRNCNNKSISNRRARTEDKLVRVGLSWNIVLKDHSTIQWPVCHRNESRRSSDTTGSLCAWDQHLDWLTAKMKGGCSRKEQAITSQDHQQHNIHQSHSSHSLRVSSRYSYDANYDILDRLKRITQRFRQHIWGDKTFYVKGKNPSWPEFKLFTS